MLYAKKFFTVVGTTSVGGADSIALRLERPEEFDYALLNCGDVVILAAAVSSPDFCSRERVIAEQVNVHGTSFFISKAISKGARVIFFSSDTVYGEQPDFFDESSMCNPLGEYAQMKHQVEKVFCETQLFKSVRLSYVFSAEDKFTQYLSNCSTLEKPAEVYNSLYRSVIYREDVVNAVVTLAMQWDVFPQKYINLGGPETFSRFEMAQVIREIMLPSLSLSITEPPPSFFDHRPHAIRMRSPILQGLLGESLHTLRQAIVAEMN